MGQFNICVLDYFLRPVAAQGLEFDESLGDEPGPGRIQTLDIAGMGHDLGWAVGHVTGEHGPEFAVYFTSMGDAEQASIFDKGRVNAPAYLCHGPDGAGAFSVAFVCGGRRVGGPRRLPGPSYRRDVKTTRQATDDGPNGGKGVYVLVRVEMGRLDSAGEDPLDLGGEFGFDGVSEASAQESRQGEFRCREGEITAVVQERFDPGGLHDGAANEQVEVAFKASGAFEIALRNWRN